MIDFKSLLVAAILAMAAVASPASPMQPAQNPTLKAASWQQQSQTLTGLFSAYWVEGRLFTALQTDQASQAQLWRQMPNAKALEYAQEDLKFIDLHYEGSEQALKQSLQNLLGKQNVQTFWQHKTGVLHVPAKVTVSDFHLYDGACDQYYYQAKLQQLQAIDNMPAKAIYQSGCANGIMLSAAQITSKDGHANLRQQPSVNAKVVATIPTHEHVIVLKTEGLWLYVALENGQGRLAQTGYVHQSQVKLLEDE